MPFPKKSDLQFCDNWRGISLLDVVGKIFARIAEGLLLNSQCSFQRGRGCVDTIFVPRQLMEKTKEHEDSLFIMFIESLR